MCMLQVTQICAERLGNDMSDACLMPLGTTLAIRQEWNSMQHMPDF